ncbi:hypothetical protein BCR35DRAFT_335521 [Leucosporidium creatinivorum]|uniref:Uncharacterized protein n=1 Tax=Leucosporidium creatinivorum TaxID=106004 RepID=A0A1Y2D9M3_9BASI|nr:hypothetical protein BCR35DRAFT_335521 [Leucosporidium creatinivorum]
MPPPPFSSTLHVPSTHCTAPSLSATLSTNSVPSNHLLLAQGRVELRVRARIRARVEGQGDQQEQQELELDAHELSKSALLREVREWLDQQKASLNIDSVEAPTVSIDGTSVTLPLISYSRSSICSNLSRPALRPPTISHSPSTSPPAGLQALDLSLLFLLPSPQTSSSQTSPSPNPTEDPAEDLIAHLLSPTDLHLTLSPLLPLLLSKIAQKLVLAFPLCFNARWIDRLEADRASHAALATSLGSMLDGLTKGGKLDTEATLLRLRLSTHLSLPLPPPPPPSTTPLSSSNSPPIPPSSTEELSTALLLLARGVGKKDAWRAVDQGEGGGARAVAVRKAGGMLALGGGGGKMARTLTEDEELLVELEEEEGEGGESGLIPRSGEDEENGAASEEEMDLFGDEDEGDEEVVEFEELCEGSAVMGYADAFDAMEEEEEEVWMVGLDGEGEGLGAEGK